MKISKNISGERVARIRKRKKIAQLELSRLVRDFGVNLDRSAIAKIEVGLRQVRDFELVALAKVLHVSPAWLLSGRRPK